MKRTLILLFLATLCRAGVSAEPLHATMTSGGVTREYYVHLPVGRSTRGLPLVLALHGGGGEGRNNIAFTHFDRAADAHGFVVVSPCGLSRRWNDGHQDPSKQLAAVDDVAFLSALIDKLVAQYGLDPARVYATGISNGGGMSYRLAAELPAKIAAIAPVASLLGPEQAQVLHPSRGVSVFLIEGVLDPVMPFRGGPIHLLGVDHGSALSYAETLRFWVGQNRCSRVNETTRRPGAQVQIWRGGRDGAEVVGWQVNQMGHTWPGSLQYLPMRTIGPVCRDFDGAEVIWNFFQSHHR